MTSPSLTVAPPHPDYWTETRRPLSCLAFLAPLLALYELGIVWVGGSQPASVRNGADHWMRGWLQQVGIHHSFLLPLLLVAGLLAWQVCGRYSWKISRGTLSGMLAESILFAFGLVLVGQINDLCFRHWLLPAPLSVAGSATQNPAVARFVSFVGAGVYEEFLFRLCLLPACYGVLRATFLPRRWSAVLAVVVTSAVFSLAHYLGPDADLRSLATLTDAVQRVHETQELWKSFCFRTLAGAFFAGLFLTRGFGITVGCHAGYDVLVGVLMAV